MSVYIEPVQKKIAEMQNNVGELSSLSYPILNSISVC
jgi:hypothetical protein